MPSSTAPVVPKKPNSKPQPDAYGKVSADVLAPSLPGKRSDEETLRSAVNQAKRQKELVRLSKIARKTSPRGQDGGSVRALFPKLWLTPKQFQVIASLIRSRGPSMTAARKVLVDGYSLSDAASMVRRDGASLSPQIVNNTVTRFKAAHTAICEGYSPIV